MMNKHTPGPWEIEWYECHAGVDDAKANRVAVGAVYWRRPLSIGPISTEHSHWGGDLLSVEEADARLIAAAPDLLEALKMAQTYVGGEGSDEEIEQVRAALAKAASGNPRENA